jgi:hypothetical protein
LRREIEGQRRIDKEIIGDRVIAIALILPHHASKNTALRQMGYFNRRINEIYLEDIFIGPFMVGIKNMNRIANILIRQINISKAFDVPA